jgi:hypothetical protein
MSGRKESHRHFTAALKLNVIKVAETQSKRKASETFNFDVKECENGVKLC